MELKYCPFCGGEADIWRKSGRYGWFMQVQCSVCDASTKTFFDGKEDKDFDVDDTWESLAAERAREAWNRRVGEVNAEPDT